MPLTTTNKGWRTTRYAGIAILFLASLGVAGPDLFAEQTCCRGEPCCRGVACGTSSTCNSSSVCEKLDLYGGLFAENLCCRDRLCGDFFGTRTLAADCGISADYSFTQFYQGVVSGGRSQEFQYGAKYDSYYCLQGEKLGFDGLIGIMHVESRYGEDANSESGAMTYPNASMLYPLPGEWEWAITELVMMQSMGQRIAITGGKYNSVDLLNMLYRHQGRGIDGFMNLNFLLPATLLRTTNLSFNGAGVLAMQGAQIQSMLMVYDTQNSSTTVAPDLFADGSVVLGYHRFFTNFAGLPGSHGVLANYSNRTYAVTDPLSYTVIPGEGIPAPQETGSWSLAYIADQLLYVDRCKPCRNLRFFSTWGLADKATSPYAWSAMVSLQASGLDCRRPADTLGVGYFYNGLSSDFKDRVSAGPLPDVQDVQGVELYYNATVTPWFHLTGDLQVIENERVSDDTALILGIRASIDL